MTKLTAKQQAFVDNKIAGVANRDAAIAAGYSVAGASVAADKLMRHPGVRTAIAAATKGRAPGTKVSAPAMPRARYDDSKSFLLDVMNHDELPLAVRADAAKQLLPYQHARLGDKGKKEKANERAKEVAGRGQGVKFTPKAPPQLTVVRD